MSDLSPTKYISELVPGRETSLLLRLSTPEPQISSSSQKVLSKSSYEYDSGRFSNENTLEKSEIHQKDSEMDSKTRKIEQVEERVEKRSKKEKAVQEAEIESSKSKSYPLCPVPGCNSRGHIKRGFLHHRRVASCPNMKAVQNKFGDQLMLGDNDLNDYFEKNTSSQLYKHIAYFVSHEILGIKKKNPKPLAISKKKRYEKRKSKIQNKNSAEGKFSLSWILSRRSFFP